ncbi:hypothetical protein L2E41_23860, partial [Salmonella enterica subsp. enterica serovar Weltevreden]|nr:hypothetical protein [Salmonella enterica subsp. enterica serovar Weltevreden]
MGELLKALDNVILNVPLGEMCVLLGLAGCVLT